MKTYVNENDAEEEEFFFWSRVKWRNLLFAHLEATTFEKWEKKNKVNAAGRIKYRAQEWLAILKKPIILEQNRRSMEITLKNPLHWQMHTEKFKKVNQLCNFIPYVFLFQIKKLYACYKLPNNKHADRKKPWLKNIQCLTLFF